MGIKILLADDSVTAQNMGKKILSEAGHEVITVSNGAAAAKKIAELKPELVLLDVFMPGYGGLELCEKIRNAAETAKLPVLLTVGRMEPYSPQEGARVKADGVIIKPFEASDLTAAVDRLAQKLKPGKAQAKQSETPKPAAEFKDESYLAWKQEAPTHEESATAESSSKAAEPEEKPYEQTVSLNASQIAAMLKVADKGDGASSPEQEFNIAAPAHSMEEFSVTPPTASMPAFGAELTESSSAEIPSYMSQYLAETATPERKAEELLSTPTANEAEQSMSSAPAFGEPLASEPPFPAEAASATVVFPTHSVLQHFGAHPTPEPAIGSAEGLELTATAPVPDAPVGKEAGLELTLQGADPSTPVTKDPALVTDPHSSTMDFVTQFGTNDSGLPEDLLQSMSSATEKSSSDEEFESRLNAAMSAFSNPSAELPSLTLPEAVSPEPIIAAESNSDGTIFGSSTPQTEPQVPSFELPVEAANVTDSLPSYGEPHAHMPPPDLPSYPGKGNEASELELPSPTSDMASFEAAGRDENSVVSTVSSTVVTPDRSPISPISMESVPVPETDESVIQQMREAFSDLPIDHSHLHEAMGSEPAPMAMAAAAAAAPAPAIASTHIGSEAELEIARALSAAVGAHDSNDPRSTTGRVTEISSGGDANAMAAAVEKVMQRELPNLVWKIMAELDQRKRS